jgi:menaquinone-specific isochorismate synthase
MKFFRTQVSDIDLATARVLAERTGWLIEDPEALRLGIGGVALALPLSGGLNGDDDPLDTIRVQEIEGDGPRGSGIVAFGSLPFDRDTPAVMTVANVTVTAFRNGETWVATAEGSPSLTALLGDVAPVDQETQSPRSIIFEPTPSEYTHNVALAVDVLRREELQKVVLARSVSGRVPRAIDPAAILSRLRRREPKCTMYAMTTTDDRRFVGASPELLVRREGRHARCHPLAGTIALPPDVSPDDYENWLLGSHKNLREHQILVDEVVANLSALYERVDHDEKPSIMALRTVAHLGSWVEASCEYEVDSPDALEVLRLLHPTPAVGGIPRSESYELILKLEGKNRGHYAGPVGWMDERGDGDWWVGIRGVMIENDEFEAWAGAGIVSESDPIAEREETSDKLASVLTSVLSDRF